MDLYRICTNQVATHTHTHACTHTHIHTQVLAHMMHFLSHTHILIHTHTCTHKHKDKCIYIQMHTNVSKLNDVSSQLYNTILSHKINITDLFTYT